MNKLTNNLMPATFILLLMSITLKAFAYCEWQEQVNRKLIKRADNGYYLIQDTFKRTGKPLAEPYYIKEKQEAEKNEITVGSCVKPAHVTITGDYITRYDDEQKTISEIRHYQEGKRVGIWERRGPTGAVNYRAVYDNDSLTGYAIQYADDLSILYEGKIRYEIAEDKEYKIGYWRYYKKGKLEQEGYYDCNGMPTGIWYNWCDGERALSFEYIDSYSFVRSVKYLIPKQVLETKKCNTSTSL